jgi:SAM-dependent methyltransferase
VNCRHCQQPLRLHFLDLGTAPPSNAYVSLDGLARGEIWLPLRLLVCEACWLVQTEDFAGREALFTADYAYFSSVSRSWLAHAKRYVEAMQARFALSPQSQVVEIAANDGYLLDFLQGAHIPCYGVEPTASTAAIARQKGHLMIEAFFGQALAKELAALHGFADLIAANNVLAHVPDINDFVAGFKVLLAPNGVATFEFPYLLHMVEQGQFDTAYHEHYSYLSLTALVPLFQKAGLKMWDVETLPTHGGSLRLYVCHEESPLHFVQPALTSLLAHEQHVGVNQAAFYQTLQPRAQKTKRALLEFLLTAQAKNIKVAGYGAAAKGNTLLNFAGVRSDLLPFIVDKNPAKQGKFTPGGRIPITDETALTTTKPEFVVILPWNLQQEVMEDLAYIRSWGGKFVRFIPEFTLF